MKPTLPIAYDVSRNVIAQIDRSKESVHNSRYPARVYCDERTGAVPCHGFLSNTNFKSDMTLYTSISYMNNELFERFVFEMFSPETSIFRCIYPNVKPEFVTNNDGLVVGMRLHNVGSINGNFMMWMLQVTRHTHEKQHIPRTYCFFRDNGFNVAESFYLASQCTVDVRAKTIQANMDSEHIAIKNRQAYAISEMEKGEPTNINLYRNRLYRNSANFMGEAYCIPQNIDGPRNYLKSVFDSVEEVKYERFFPNYQDGTRSILDIQGNTGGFNMTLDKFMKEVVRTREVWRNDGKASQTT